MKKKSILTTSILVAGLLMVGCSDGSKEAEPLIVEADTSPIPAMDIPAVALDPTGFDGRTMEGVPAVIQFEYPYEDKVVYHVNVRPTGITEKDITYVNLVVEFEEGQRPEFKSGDYIRFSGVVDADYDLSDIQVERTPVVASKIVAGDIVEVTDPTIEEKPVPVDLIEVSTDKQDYKIGIEKVAYGEKYVRVYYNINESDTGADYQGYVIPRLQVDGQAVPTTENDIQLEATTAFTMKHMESQVAIFDLYDTSKEVEFILEDVRDNADFGSYTFKLPALTK